MDDSHPVSGPLSNALSGHHLPVDRSSRRQPSCLLFWSRRR